MTQWRFLLALLMMLAGVGNGMTGTLAQFRTVFGDIEIELYDQDKPATVQNFIRYLQSGAYENGFAHRLVPGFVIQGGGYTVTNRGTANWNILSVPPYPAISNEFAVGRRLSNTYGTLSMAKLGGNTNSATSQWFINLADNTFLDAADTNNLFVVFGRVLVGTNILNRFNSFQYWNGTQMSNLVYQGYSSPFDTLPLLRPYVTSTNLVYLDATLLQVSVQAMAGGGRKISWNSAAGLTNVVEFTTNFPPTWSSLLSTNGNGARMDVVDNSAVPSRFYRVRVR